MADEKTCPHCGKPVPPTSLGGICPECMLKAGLATQTEGPGATGPHGTKVVPPLPKPEEVAPLFPQLEILECLGRGGMGVVYKARQPRLNRLVALKILAREKEQDAQFAERFTREAQALARLNHPNIVTVHDFGETGRHCYLVMEFVDGLNLRQLLQAGKMKPEQALAIVPKICEALQYAHEQGIVHRDIKPENILLDKQGRVKIADFGIAKMVGNVAQTSTSAGSGGVPAAGPGNTEQGCSVNPQAGKPALQDLTEAGHTVGTPHYMAPEQIEKPQTVDHRADIYSLGVVFYEMLTGELPLGKFQPPSKKVQVDVRLDEVVLHALEKEPERRYQQANEVKTVVETIAATSESSRSRREEAQTEKAGSQSRLTPAATAFRRGKRVGLWIFLLIVLAAAVITFLLPKTYVGIARVRLTGLSPQNYNPYYVQNEFQVIKSDRVLKKVATSLNLGQRWGKQFNGGRPLNNDQVMVLMRRWIDLEPVRNTDMIDIGVWSQSPKDAAAIANKIAETYCTLPPGHSGEIIDRAVAPFHPIRPNFLLNIFIGVVAGGVVGIFAGLAFGLFSFWRLRALQPQASPPVQKPDRFWRRFAMAVLALIILIPASFYILAILLPIGTHFAFDQRTEKQGQSIKETTHSDYIGKAGLQRKVKYAAKQASVQDIVQNLAEQAGLKYGWQKSFAQTDPLCRQWVRNVTIDGETCQQALDQILKPIGLRYQVENGVLVLSRQDEGTTKSDYIGQTWFPLGDSIEITSVERTQNQMTVKGHYNLVSHDKAELGLSVTVANENVSQGKGEMRPIFKGHGDFTLVYLPVVPGLPHVSMIGADGHSFAQVYFGTKAEALEESRATSITNRVTSNGGMGSSKGVKSGPVRETILPALGEHPRKEDTYTITSVMRILKPVNVADMNDEFQGARLLAQDNDSCTVEVTYYPLFRPVIGENPNWRKDDAGMVEYLRPTPTENWDERMRHDLIAELRQAGIDPDHLTDKQLVEQVSRWAMKRAHTTHAFSIWAVYYPDGKPTVYPPLREAFDRQKPDPTWTDQQMFDQEVLGRSMFYNKVHGACTSSAVYLATIFRALGIPTRIIICIPPFDPNDESQAKMFYDNIHDNQVRETVRAALDGMSGFDDHMFNEVYVGHHWVRLNYDRLGQPILDAHYFGLLTHIYTCSSLSQAPLAQTWGMRYFKYPAGQPKLASVNPYRLISVHDHFGVNAHLDNPPVPVAQLRTATIIGLYRADSPEVPKGAADYLKRPNCESDFVIAIKEWIPGAANQLRAFRKRAGHEFLLIAPQHPDIRVRLTGLDVAGNGSFQAFGAHVVPEDRAKLVPGVTYSIQPINISETYRWSVVPGIGISFEQPLTIKTETETLENKASSATNNTPTPVSLTDSLNAIWVNHAALLAVECRGQNGIVRWSPDGTPLPPTLQSVLAGFGFPKRNGGSPDYVFTILVRDPPNSSYWKYWGGGCGSGSFNVTEYPWSEYASFETNSNLGGVIFRLATTFDVEKKTTSVTFGLPVRPVRNLLEWNGPPFKLHVQPDWPKSEPLPDLKVGPYKPFDPVVETNSPWLSAITLNLPKILRGDWHLYLTATDTDHREHRSTYDVFVGGGENTRRWMLDVPPTDIVSVKLQAHLNNDFIWSEFKDVHLKPNLHRQSNPALTKQPPIVVKTSPQAGATDVDPAITEITVTFDRDMGRGFSWTGGGPDFPPSPKGQGAYWRDKRTCVLPVKLQAAHYYRVGVNSTSIQNFRSTDGVPARPSVVYFATQGASERVKAMVAQPEIVSLVPANGAQDVDPNLTEIRATFNMPMGGGFSWTRDDSEFPPRRKGKHCYWTEDHKTCVLPVQLQPGHTYHLGLNGPSYNDFQSADGVPLAPVDYRFKTRAN